MKRVAKYVTPSVHYEVGDFYGAGTDEAISSMIMTDTNQLELNTGQGVYHFTLKPKDYLVFEDGTWEIIKDKYDKEDI